MKKGTKHTEEAKRKIGLASKGRVVWNKGIPCLESTKEKIGRANKGRTQTQEERLKRSESLKGRIVTDATRKKISNSLRGHPQYNTGKTHFTREQVLGKKNVNWKGGISSLYDTIKRSQEYKNWRKTIYERDRFTCQECNYKGRQIVAHHIKGFADYPDLRFVPENGITLCRGCHISLHNKSEDDLN